MAITQEAWLQLVGEEITDPAHIERWRRLTANNPAFASEILIRALIESDGDPRINKQLIDMATWVFAVVCSDQTSNLETTQTLLA